MELAFLPATVQAELVRRREVSPVELVETYVARIERLDPLLRSYVTVSADDALRAARRAEAEEPERPFHGVPITIKDLTETAGIRTTFSSRAFASYVPSGDPAVVRRLREAGFIVLGKTNTPELGTTPVTESELNGACRSPWALDRTAGGSSGGAAAALAAGLCPAAHGTDGGGSIRIPASCCGVFGLKPARGRVSHAPYGGFSGLSTAGPITRTVLDAASLLDVMAGYETGDPYWAPPPERPFASAVGEPPGRLRIGVTTEPPIDVPIDPLCAEAAREAGELLAELGHEIVDAAPAWRDDELLPLFARVYQLGPGLYEVDDPLLLEPLNRRLAEEARATSSVDYMQALLRLQAYARRVVAFWDDHDLLLTPTLALPPVPIGWLREEEDPWDQFARSVLFTPFSPVANITGQPAASLPLRWSDEGPIGVQLTARPADEMTLLRVSAQLEQARPWKERIPPLAATA